MDRDEYKYVLICTNYVLISNNIGQPTIQQDLQAIRIYVRINFRIRLNRTITFCNSTSNELRANLSDFSQCAS